MPGQWVPAGWLSQDSTHQLHIALHTTGEVWGGKCLHLLPEVSGPGAPTLSQ